MLKEARPYSSASGKQPAWQGSALALRQPLPCLQPSNKHDYKPSMAKCFPPTQVDADGKDCIRPLPKK